MNYWIGVMAIDTVLISFYVFVAAKRIVLVSGPASTGETAVILDEHRRDLRGAVRAYRWIGVVMTLGLAVTAGAALWELISGGVSAVFGGLSLYTTALAFLLRLIFKRVDMYEQMYRDSLPPRTAA